MNYKEAREYMGNAEKRGSILGLATMRNLMKKLGNVQDELKILHIAGTNGKGSTLAFLSEILKQAGYQVGKYTSPAVFDYREIFTINGNFISEEEYAKCVTKIAQAVAKMEASGEPLPTVFEMETALAYLYFYKQNCDIVLMETGMGGDEDATNVCNHTLLSILTPISLDHMAFLGDTISEIATHKAGIIKQNSAVVSAIQESDAKEVIEKTAKGQNAFYIQTGKPENIIYEAAKTMFDYRSSNGVWFEDLNITMLGAFQPENACVAVEAALYLNQNGFPVTNEQIRTGLKLARWHGRFEKLGESPAIYFDGGHNPGAAEYIRKSIEIYFTNRKIVYIIGVLADKDYESVLKQTAEYASEIITVTPHNKRALDGEKLKETALQYHENVLFVPDIGQAVKQALHHAGGDGVILIFGSLSYLNEVKEAYYKTKEQRNLWKG